MCRWPGTRHPQGTRLERLGTRRRDARFSPDASRRVPQPGIHAPHSTTSDRTARLRRDCRLRPGNAGVCRRHRRAPGPRPLRESAGSRDGRPHPFESGSRRSLVGGFCGGTVAGVKVVDLGVAGGLAGVFGHARMVDRDAWGTVSTARSTSVPLVGAWSRRARSCTSEPSRSSVSSQSMSARRSPHVGLVEHPRNGGAADQAGWPSTWRGDPGRGRSRRAAGWRG